MSRLHTHRHIHIFVAVLTVLAAAVAPIPVAADDTLALDSETALSTESAKDAFNQSGVATASPAVADLTITVAEEPSDVGLSKYRTGLGKTYLQFDYNGGLTRDIRIHVPKAYFAPRAVELTSLEGGTKATLRPSDSREYTIVTLSVDGPTTATFSVSAARGTWSSGRSWVKEAVNETTGVSVPSLAPGTNWQYIEQTRLSGNDSTVPIPTHGKDLTIQYDANSSENGEQWLGVQTCDGSNEICTFTKEGDPNTVYVLSKTTDPPQIRYKRGTAPMAWGQSIVEDLTSIPDRLMADLEALWPGGDS